MVVAQPRPHRRHPREQGAHENLAPSPTGHLVLTSPSSMTTTASPSPTPASSSSAKSTREPMPWRSTTARSTSPSRLST